MNLIEKMLVLLAGAHLPTLNKSLADKSKFVAVGLTILFTGIFASLSGGYAIYKVFHSTAIDNNIDGKSLTFIGIPAEAILLGMLWGLMIMNIDRYIVMSMKKRDNKLHELLTATPRLVLAVFISLVVAKPLEVRIFQDRINSQLLDTKTERAKSQKADIYEITDKLLIDSMRVQNKSEIEDLKIKRANQCPTPDCKSAFSEKEDALTEYNSTKARTQPLITQSNREIQRIKNSDQYKEEYLAYDSTIRKRLTTTAENLLARQREIFQTNVAERDRAREFYQRKLMEYNRLNQEYKDEIATRLTAAETERKEIKKEQKNANAKAEKLIEDAEKADSTSFTDNFAAQIEALGHLTQWKDDTINENGEVVKADNTMWYINLAIILLFIIIETAPIFVKLITDKGPYDIAQEADERTHKAHSILNANSVIAEAEYKSQIYLQPLLKNQQVQIDLVDQALDDWKNSKLKELQRGNLSNDEFKSFIKEVLAFRAMAQNTRVYKTRKKIIKRLFRKIRRLFSNKHLTSSP